uniref:Uncharacterized protein n=1 Tax=Ditylenchus dipsaci TaxID=166011 RepID=A0A915CWT5_9BILA
MFQRKKTSDHVQCSLQRFSDMHRDSTSRAKHFRLAMEALSPQDKRQLVDDFSFEAFHLIDSLLLHPDLSVDAQVVFDAESALWTLEQVLCFAPELVGKGWQRNAIECILKRALLPRNLLGVRKIAIRLFLIWYQCLAVYNGTSRMLDVVFQCCLPYFPLKNSQRSERILQEYCESPQ